MSLAYAPLPTVESPEVVDDRVRRQVWGLLAGLYPAGRLSERRVDQRFPYPYLVELHPVAADGVTPLAESIVVAGKHLSERGLGFYHPQPLPFRRVVASLETADRRRLHFLVDVTWCRFSTHGWYDSGGKFLAVVNMPPTAA